MAIFKLNQNKRINLQIEIGKEGASYETIQQHIGIKKSATYAELTTKSILKVNQYICNKCEYRFQCTYYETTIGINKKDDLLITGLCPMLEKPMCTKLKHFPFVCNYCENRIGCKKLKRYYDAVEAHKRFETLKSEPRKIIKLSQEELRDMDKIVTPAVRKKQSLYHIWACNEEINKIISQSTLKRYLYDERFTARMYELPMKNRFDPVRPSTITKQRQNSRPKDEERSFEAFVIFLSQQLNKKDYWEYDSVVGKRLDKQAILTITHVEFDFQFGILFSKNNPNDLLLKMRDLQNKLGDEFWKIFKINLSDNGIEFSRFTEIEFEETTGEVKSKVFFTRPSCPSDKGDCENNHKLVRYIFPKGISLDFLTQDIVDWAFSNINGVRRKSKGGKTPYELFVERYGKDPLGPIGIKYIDPKKICLNPILRKNN